MGAARTLRRGGTVALLLVGAIRTPLEGQPAQARVTITFSPLVGAGARIPSVAFELVDPGAGAVRGLPRLTLSGEREGLRLASYAGRLPTLRVGRLAFSGTYGDERVAIPTPVAALDGLAIDPRTVRGVTLVTGHAKATTTIVLGRLDRPPIDPLRGLLPRFVAAHGQFTPRPGISLAPRAVMPLARERSSSGLDPGAGLGAQAELGHGLRLVADAGVSRSACRWAPLLGAGLLGRWQAGHLEASVRRADQAVRWLGSLPFAGQDREVIAGRLRFPRGLAIDGQVARTAPHSRASAGTSRTLRRVRVELPRVRGTEVAVADQRESWTAGSSTVAALDVRPAHRLPFIRIEQHREQHLRQRKPIQTMRVLTEGSVPAGRGGAIKYQVVWVPARAGAPSRRLAVQIGSRISFGTKLTVVNDTELEVTSFVQGTGRIGIDVAPTRTSRLTIGYRHGPGVPPAGRVEARLTRIISF